jgi:hypothetical protein
MPKSKMSLAKSVKTIKKSIKKMMPKTKLKVVSPKSKVKKVESSKVKKLKVPSKELSLGSLKNKKVESFKNVKSVKSKVVSPKSKVLVKKDSVKLPAKSSKSVPKKEKEEVKKPVIKLRPTEPAVPPTVELLNMLVTKARTRGFVTETEILHSFPQVEDYIFDYELFLERLQKNSVTIVEEMDSFLDEASNIKKAKQLDEIIGTEKDRLKFDISELLVDLI